MAVPTYDQFIEPLLRVLVQCSEGMPASVAYEQTAHALGLSETDKQQLLPSGTQEVYKNRIAWAHDRLKRAKLSSSPKRGFWKVTLEGIAFVNKQATPFPNSVVANLALVKNQSDNGTSNSLVETVITSPDDRLAQAVEELRQVAETELLELLSKVTPTFFETIVLDLLYKLGYGASRADLQRVGRSGDGGIDGVIALDRLGLEKIYVQAKRWQGNVGRPDLQAFYGALAGQKAKKGVFITTSAYTAQATEFAKSVDGLVLVDGKKLVALMVDFELGVSSKIIKIPKIDGDYFEDVG